AGAPGAQSEEPGGAEVHLRERMVYLLDIGRIERAEFHVRDHTDDLARNHVSRIREMLADGILPGPIAVSDGLVDDHDRLRAGVIALREHAAFQHRSPNGIEVAGAHLA